jgi:sortase A
MLSKILFVIGIICLGLYGFVTVEAYLQQAALRSALDKEAYHPLSARADIPNPARPRPPRHLEDGDLFGRLEIPRLNMSVMVMEGDADRILRLGAGHVPGTPMAIAGHRDTFFRPLKNLQQGDEIRMTTTRGTFTYRVARLEIVAPDDMSVLAPSPIRSLTLVTCYPFAYVGPAPQRFIIHAR